MNTFQWICFVIGLYVLFLIGLIFTVIAIGHLQRREAPVEMIGIPAAAALIALLFWLAGREEEEVGRIEEEPSSDWQFPPKWEGR